MLGFPRDIVRNQTSEVVKASLEICRLTRANLAQSETTVRLSRQTIDASVALLSRVQQSTSSSDFTERQIGQELRGSQVHPRPVRAML